VDVTALLEGYWRNCVTVGGIAALWGVLWHCWRAIGGVAALLEDLLSSCCTVGRLSSKNWIRFGGFLDVVALLEELRHNWRSCGTVGGLLEELRHCWRTWSSCGSRWRGGRAMVRLRQEFWRGGRNF